MARESIIEGSAVGVPMKPFVTISAMLCLATLAIAQQDAKIDKAQKPITLDVNRVNMLFTVSDKKGRFVTDLGKTDFEVFESKHPQNIIEFTAETDLPLRLAILI